MKRTVSGIRGVFGEDLSLEDVLEFCSNFSSLIESGKCVVGMDTRESGPAIKDATSTALTGAGIDVFDLGMVPTPVVFREARKYGAGIMVSASHNPTEWNGMKFIIDGKGISESQLPQIINRQQAKQGAGSEQKISSSYTDDAAGLIGSVKGMPEIAVDIGGGAARDFAPGLLRKIGCSVEVLNRDLAGCSRGPDPTSDDLTELAAATNRGDIGFAFDLDGDRLVVVRNGKKQTPDVTLGLGAAKALELGCRKFVLSIDTSISVERFIRGKGGTVKRSKVGEANVVAMMSKESAQAGGEGSSGGFILPEFNCCRDGILAGGLIASMLESPEFDEVLNHMEGYRQKRDKIRVDTNLHDRVMEETHSRLAGQYSEVNTVDGIRGVIDENSWVLIRKSNTEDVIRVSAESDDMQRCGKILKETSELVRESYEKVR